MTMSARPIALFTGLKAAGSFKWIFAAAVLAAMVGTPGAADARGEYDVTLETVGKKIDMHHDHKLSLAQQRAFDDVLRMCREITDHKLSIRVACAGRTVVSDITPMVEISQRAGIPVEVYAFIGSSPT